jgi:hypothetical protein
MTTTQKFVTAACHLRERPRRRRNWPDDVAECVSQFVMQQKVVARWQTT